MTQTTAVTIEISHIENNRKQSFKSGTMTHCLTINITQLEECRECKYLLQIIFLIKKMIREMNGQLGLFNFASTVLAH